MLKQFWASFIRTLWRAVWKGLHSALAGRYAGEEGIAGPPALEAREVCFLPESETFARAGASHTKWPCLWRRIWWMVSSKGNFYFLLYVLRLSDILKTMNAN